MEITKQLAAQKKETQKEMIFKLKLIYNILILCDLILDAIVTNNGQNSYIRIGFGLGIQKWIWNRGFQIFYL